jgi:MFS family permease
LNYRELFANYAIVRQLAFVQLFAYFGAWFSNVAIYSSLVYFGASSVIISWVMAMHFLPAVLIAPFSGALLDRFDLKKMMIVLIVTEMVMTLSFLSIQEISDVWLLMLFLFVRSLAASMFFSAQMSLLPRVIDAKALHKANEIHSIIWSFTYAAGMALGGIVVNAFGATTAYLIDVAFFIVALIVFVRISYQHVAQESTQKIIKMITEGFGYILARRYIIKLILLHASVGLLSFDTIVTLLADYEYKMIIAIPLAIGITNAMKAFSFMIGPLFISRYIGSERLALLLVLQGVFIIVWALVQKSFYFGLIGIFLSGLVTTTIWSYSYALLQNKIERKYLGRVLAYNEMIFMLSNMTTSLFVGYAATMIPLGAITAFLGILFFGVALFFIKYKEELV